MSQALHTSATGINCGQQQINVIANNVANINTVAFKSANMTFETLFSNTLSYGSAATKNRGGTNPMQIGLGVKVGGISRNFNVGTFVNTGRDMDVMISGNGYFVVTDGRKQFYTRDGVFALDSQGNLITKSGMKVLGAKAPYSGTASSDTVRIPTNLKTTITDTPKDEIEKKVLTKLNCVSIGSGTFKVNITDKNDNNDIIIPDIELEVDSSMTLGQNVSAFNDALNAASWTDPEGNTHKASEYFTVDVDADGHVIFDVKDPDNYGYSLDPVDTNFLAETGLSNKNTVSKTLNQSVTIQDLLDFTDENGVAVSSVTIINENGIISASYSDGSNLTTQINEDNAAEWRFTTPEGVIITGLDVTTKGSITQDSNMIIELASFINESGLVSLNNNLWEWGADAGQIFYGMAGEMAFGTLESGGYEGSNVDIATELSNMITAQRMIQMNSRVFSTASSVMETLAYLGQ
ncbi:MAG: flagellar hook-basal body complex protein [bacterium]|nr:flagellar hook-basal body complex protein [bacterium]